MTIVEYLKAFRRRWILILGCFLLATAIGYAISPDGPAEPTGAGYRASLTLVPSPEVTTNVNLFLAADLATGPDVARLAAAQLPAGVETAEPESIGAGVDQEAGSIVISATASDQARAAVYAEAYSAATIEFFQETTTESSDEALERAQAELETIEANLEQLREQLENDPGDVVLQARVQSETTQYGIVYQRIQDLISAEDPPPPLQVLGSPQVSELEPGLIQAPDDRRVRALLVGAVGLLLGLGLAITVDRLDTRLRERDEVEEAFGLPVLAEIPTVGRRARTNHALVTALRPDSAAAEAYRSLRSAITLVTQSGHNGDGTKRERSPYAAPKVLVVTGADGSQGKSTTIANLAAAIAETGRTVIVIDCDFRKPEAHLFLDAKPRNRLADLVTGHFGGYLDQMLRSTAVRGVELVSSIEPVRDHTSAVAKLPGLVAEARERADVVLIDSSPLLVTSDAVDVLGYADAALVACRVGRLTYTQAIRSRRLLQRADVTALGVVLTGTRRSRGTPYGQPTRRQRLLNKVGKWAAAPGPDRYDPGAYTSSVTAADNDASGAHRAHRDEPYPRVPLQPSLDRGTAEPSSAGSRPERSVTERGDARSSHRRSDATQGADRGKARRSNERPSAQRETPQPPPKRAKAEPRTESTGRTRRVAADRSAAEHSASEPIAEDETVEFSTVAPDALPADLRDGISQRGEARTYGKSS